LNWAGIREEKLGRKDLLRIEELRKGKSVRIIPGKGVKKNTVHRKPKKNSTKRERGSRTEGIPAECKRPYNPEC